MSREIKFRAWDKGLSNDDNIPMMTQAYRTYYILEKSSLAQYTRRPKPEWLIY